MLEKVDSQHAFNAHRPLTGTLRLGVEEFDHHREFFPGYDDFHLIKKLLLASFLRYFPNRHRKAIVDAWWRSLVMLASIL